MLFGIVTEDEENIRDLLSMVERRSFNFPIPFFSVDMKKRSFNISGMITLISIKVKYPPFFLIGLLPIFYSWLAWSLPMFLLGCALLIPGLLFITPLPYLLALRLYLRKNGYQGRIKYFGTENAAALYAGLD